VKVTIASVKTRGQVCPSIVIWMHSREHSPYKSPTYTHQAQGTSSYWLKSSATLAVGSVCLSLLSNTYLSIHVRTWIFSAKAATVQLPAKHDDMEVVCYDGDWARAVEVALASTEDKDKRGT
jgi:hypothetical protein